THKVVFAATPTALASHNKPDSGAGNETVYLNGNSGDSTMRNVKTAVLAGGHDYSFTFDDATISAGQTLTIDATALTAPNAVFIDDTAETDGSLHILGKDAPLNVAFSNGAVAAASTIDTSGETLLTLAGDFSGNNALTLDPARLTHLTTLNVQPGHHT